MMTTNFSTIFDQMFSLGRAMEHALAAETGQSGLAPTWSGRGRGQLWLPPVDTYETEGSFVIELDLPGVHPENVDISFERGTLTIQGTRAPTLQKPEKGELRVYNAERLSGPFVRAIRLPEYVDGEHIEASYTNGVLTVSIPKAPTARPRKIAVRSGVESTHEAKQLNA